jgi:hypothetical protein
MFRMGGEHAGPGNGGHAATAGNPGRNDNVVEVAFDRRRGEAATASTAAEDTPQSEARAIKACLRHLQEQAAAIDERMAAQLIGAAAQAIGEDGAGGGRRA